MTDPTQRRTIFSANKDQIIRIFLWILLLVFAIKCVSTAFTTTLSFDGGMNVQVSQNLANHLRYATSYNGLTDFDARVQTGIPVLLPVAILIKLFGATAESALMVNAIYMILLMLVVLYYLKYCVQVDDIFLFPAVFFLWGTPEIFTLGFGLYGEIPTVFFLILSLIFLNKYDRSLTGKYIFLTGFIFGIGYLVKTVILIAIPAFIFVLMYDILIKYRLSIKRYLYHVALWVIGLALPISLFEVYKVFTLGLREYIQWWQTQWFLISAQAGVKHVFSTSVETSNKFLVHLDYLSSFTGLHPLVIVVILLGILLLFFGILIYGLKAYRIDQTVGKSRTFYFSNDFLVLMSVSLSYFGWWLLITPTQKAWYRRIIDGSILLEVCLILAGYLIYRLVSRKAYNKTNTNYPVYGLIPLILSIPAAISLLHTQNYIISFSPTPNKVNLTQASTFIRNLPATADIYGYDWWQAPTVAYAAGRSFDDIYRSNEMEDVGEKQDKYLIIDPNVYIAGDHGYVDVLATYQYHEVFSRGGYAIYQLLNKYPYAPFTEMEKRRVTNHILDFTTDCENCIVRNVYLNENNESGKWAQKYSGYLLNHNNENTLHIVFGVFDIHAYDHQPIIISVSIDQKLYSTSEIISEGIQEIDIPMNDVPNGTIEVLLESNSRVIALKDARRLSLFMQKIELLNR